MKEAHQKIKWSWWLQINSRNSVLSVENMNTREKIVGKIKTTITDGQPRTTKTKMANQEISRATMEHQDTPIIFSAIFARRKDTWNLSATPSNKKKDNPNKDKKKMWC